ncbi:MAG: ATP-binding protein [Pleomorphochaeta sp.]
MRNKNLEFDFGIEHSGYRLKKFQLYNWGTFDNHLVNLNIDAENTLLTGSNGSGKTTLVDAILTLLVPTNDRTYNLSSGNDGRNGRSEESYVLGAYSTEKNEKDYTANRKTLRDKSTHSILLAIFSNRTAANSITLMQFRYFSSNGALKRQYFVIEGELTLEMLNQRKVGYNPATNWIQDIKKAFSETEITTYDTFKRYSHDFSKKFGFRYKDKAIKIFSQTVGMKDLHDINGFIREKMLDENDSFDIFTNISKNYNNLQLLKNQIEKEELQIKLLENINESYSSFKYYSTKKEKKELTKDKYLKIWEAQTSLSIIKEEIKELSATLEKEEIEIKTTKDNKTIIENNIKEINQTLFSDARNSRIEELSNRRKDLINTINHLKTQVNIYEKNLNILHLTYPNDENSFYQISKDCSNKISIIENKLEKLDDDKNEILSIKNNINNKIDNINNQLLALKDINSNIPLQYIELRKKISEETSINIEDLIFLGEVIRINNTSLDKTHAIEALIRPIALSLLVLPNHSKTIAKYIETLDLNIDLNLIIVKEVQEQAIINGEDKDQLSIFDDDDEIIFEENSSPIYSNLMIDIKEDYQYKDFIKDYLSNNFAYSFSTNNETTYTQSNSFNENALLNKNDIFYKPITNEKQDFHVIGWDTDKKLIRLTERNNELTDNLLSIEVDLQKQESLIKKENKKLASLIYLSEFKDYSSINISQYTEQIENIDQQLLELKASTSDLDNLREKLIEIEKEKDDIDYTIDNLNQQIGGLKSALNNKESFKKQIDTILFDQDLTSYFEPISQMINEYNLPSTFSDTKEVKYYKEKIEALISKEINDNSNSLYKTEKDLISQINQFINPKASIINQFPSWSNDTNNLTNDIAAIDLFNLLLDKLKTDSLPKYKEQFSNLRTRQIQQDIIDLNSSLKEWNRKIKDNIVELNDSLNSLIYQKSPETKIKITIEATKDKEIRKFKTLLHNALPTLNDENISETEKQIINESFITGVDNLVNILKENERFALKVLDVRNWYQFGVEEYFSENNEQARYYKDSSAISGGQKAKLAYTILAAAIAHQFDVFNYENSSRAFRFVIVDEAFSKSDDENSRYAMELFKAMDLQLMVVTPMDKVNLVEPYINSVQITINSDNRHSFVHSIKKEEVLNYNK